MDQAKVIEGSALIVIGVIAASLFIAISLSVLGAYAPMRGSALPENPNYLYLTYNMSETVYRSGMPETAYALTGIKIDEINTSYVVVYQSLEAVGGVPGIIEAPPGSTVHSVTTEESQPFVMPESLMSTYPIRLIPFNGSMVPVAVVTGNESALGETLKITAYYQLSSGVLLEAHEELFNASGTIAGLNITLVHETVLSPSSEPRPISVGLFGFSLGVLAVIAGVGLGIGVVRLIEAA